MLSLILFNLDEAFEDISVSDKIDESIRESKDSLIYNLWAKLFKLSHLPSGTNWIFFLTFFD